MLLLPRRLLLPLPLPLPLPPPLLGGLVPLPPAHPRAAIVAAVVVLPLRRVLRTPVGAGDRRAVAVVDVGPSPTTTVAFVVASPYSYYSYSVVADHCRRHRPPRGKNDNADRTQRVRAAAGRVDDRR